MTDKRKTTLTKVINFLKDEHPDLSYDILPQISFSLDPEISDKSSNIKDFKFVLNLIKDFPIVNDIKLVLEERINSKKESKKRKVEIVEEKIPKKKKKVVFDPESKINCEESKLLFSNNHVLWWKPFEKNSSGNYDPKCYCNKDCKKENNQFSGIKEILCKAPMKKKCQFRISCHAYLKLIDYLENLKRDRFPLPTCSCQKDNLTKSHVVIRGSAPAVENFKFWFYCEGCRSTFPFQNFESKVKKLILQNKKKSKKSVREDLDEEEELDMITNDVLQALNEEDDDSESDDSESEEQEE